MTGKPISAACAAASSASFKTPVPGNSGRPKILAFVRDVTLSPHFIIASGEGPIQVSPHFLHSSANFAFSLRKPYPGWIASAFVTSATAMIAGTLR